jgi:VanZ family protein
LEGLQSLVPYRSAEVTDLAVNLVAVVLGLLLVELRRTWRGG